jgi:hypothetical protein
MMAATKKAAVKRIAVRLYHEMRWFGMAILRLTLHI